VKYLDPERLSKLDDAGFRRREPYPWVNPEGLLTEEAFRMLAADLPPLEQMGASFGRERMHGQTSHDRYVLEWKEGLDIARSWREFIAELNGTEYRGFLRRMLGSNAFDLTFHWHYAPRGCSLSPHCDARRKLGSHIFYFNPVGDWDPTWGGGTLVLDDRGRFKRRSAPAVEEFDDVTAADAVGNRSLLFVRRRNSWHGMRPLTCPEGRLRKVFIAVLTGVGPVERARRLVGLSAR
jgi:hypothetical protein